MTFSPNCISPFFQPRAQKQNQPVIAIVTVIASCRLRVVFVSFFCLRFVLVSLRLASCRLRVVFVSSSCRFSFLSSLRPRFVSSRFVFVHLYCEHSPLPSTRVVIPRPSDSSLHFLLFRLSSIACIEPGPSGDFAVAMASVDDNFWNMLPLFLLVLVSPLSLH